MKFHPLTGCSAPAVQCGSQQSLDHWGPLSHSMEWLGLASCLLLITGVLSLLGAEETLGPKVGGGLLGFPARFPTPGSSRSRGLSPRLDPTVTPLPTVSDPPFPGSQGLLGAAAIFSALSGSLALAQKRKKSGYVFSSFFHEIQVHFLILDLRTLFPR